MILTLIGTLMVGVGAACVAFVIARTFRRKLPLGVFALVGGAGMMAYIIWTDYTWYPRVSAQLPEAVVVLDARETSSFFRPWTLIAAPVDRFMALGGRGPHPDEPDYVLTEIGVVQRWNPTTWIPQIVDCAGARRADVGAATALPEGASPLPLDWFALAPDDPLLAHACLEPVGGG